MKMSMIDECVTFMMMMMRREMLTVGPPNAPRKRCCDRRNTFQDPTKRCFFMAKKSVRMPRSNAFQSCRNEREVVFYVFF